MKEDNRSGPRSFFSENLFLITGIAFAILFWIFESYNHFIQFHNISFWDEIFHPNTHELWMRAIIVLLFLLFGISTQLLFNKIKAAENITKLAHAELDQIFQTAADGMRVIDNDFNTLRVNRTFLALTGLTKQEVEGKKCHKIFSGPKCFTPDCPLTLIMKGEKRVEYETNKERTDGTRIPCIVTATPFSDANGRLIGIVEDFKDISGQKRAEKEKAQLEDDLRHSQKMEAVGTLAGGIAHDFNNILNGMLTYTRLLKDGLPKGSEQENFVQEIMKGGKQAANLVRQILAFSKRTEYKRRPLQIQPIIREALKFLKRSLPTTIELRQHLDSDTRAVLADETQIYQVVMNLCTNAYHAMREHGGILEVRLEQVDTDSVLIGKIGDLKGRKFVRLTVSDTGHGMDKFTRQRIFDPYFTTKEQGEGTGLGLSRVHGIVMRHKGAISVKSRPGKGSEFTIYLPVVDLAPATQEPHKETKLTHEGHGRILFVDDAEYNARSGKLILESIGFEVTALTDSAQALEVFREDPNRFDIVVTDQTMPQMTGFELAQELFHVRPDLPVIMITGHSEIVDSERAKSIGIREFLLKPLDIDLLAETITNILDSAKKNSG